LVGYSGKNKAYRCDNIRLNKIVEIIDENIYQTDVSKIKEERNNSKEKKEEEEPKDEDVEQEEQEEKEEKQLEV
jgi:hypothetical protein